MEWDLVQKVGKSFEVDGKTFYDLNVGPNVRRAVVAGVGVLDKRYGFIWYYTPVVETKMRPAFSCIDAAKILVNQFQFHLIDHRSLLFGQNRLTKTGDEIGYKKDSHPILDNRANRHCSDREYASAT